MSTSTKFCFCFLALLMLISCSKTNRNNSFESIDYSSFWGYYFNNIKIFNNGTIYVAYEHENDSKNYYYAYTLNKSQLDTLSLLLEKVYSIKIEPRYDLGMDSGRSFSLIINSKRGRLVTAYDGPWSVDSLKPLINFVSYLTGISRKVKTTVDSTFVFESRGKLIMPYPPEQKTK